MADRRGAQKPRRGPSTTRTTRGRRALSPAPDPEPEPRRRNITTRAAILGLAVCAVIVTLAVPLRSFLAQRGQISSLESEQAAAKRRVAALEQQQRLFDDPAYVEQQARERLHFVMPGQHTYIVVTPSQAPVAPVRHGRSQVVDNPASSWFDRLWSSTEAAGRETPAPKAHPVVKGSR